MLVRIQVWSLMVAAAEGTENISWVNFLLPRERKCKYFFSSQKIFSTTPLAWLCKARVNTVMIHQVTRKNKGSSFQDLWIKTAIHKHLLFSLQFLWRCNLWHFSDLTISVTIQPPIHLPTGYNSMTFFGNKSMHVCEDTTQYIWWKESLTDSH